MIKLACVMTHENEDCIWQMEIYFLALEQTTHFPKGKVSSYWLYINDFFSISVFQLLTYVIMAVLEVHNLSVLLFGGTPTDPVSRDESGLSQQIWLCVT